MDDKLSAPSKPTGIIAWFVHNPVAANLLMIIILLAGIATAMGLRIEGFPSIDPTTITVDVTYESGDASQAEEGIAVKIEEALLGTRGIKTITSTSSGKGATVVIEAISDYDLDRLNTEVKNQVDGIPSFPRDAEKPVVSQQLWEQSALWISVYGNVDQASLQQVSRQLENDLLSLPNITKVTRSGWKSPEIAIEIDEQMLQAHNLTLDQLAQRIRAESLNETSGELRSADGIIMLKADKQGYYYQDFADIVVAQYADGSEVRLADIARITDGFVETPNIRSRFQGKPAVNLEVRAGREANIVEMAEDARALVKEWQQSQRLPENVSVELWFDQSLDMQERLGLVLENGLIGIILVMLVLTIFLNLNVAFWVAMGLPVCFAGGLLMMGSGFFDLTLNQLTTFGFVLVLGILVDDALVVGESVYTAQQQYGKSIESTIKGVHKVAVPTMFGLLTTVAAFYPLSMIEGGLGQLFAQFAFVCTACLLFSLVESKLILPAHLRHLNTERKPPRHTPGRMLATVQRGADSGLMWFNQSVYRPAVTRALQYRYAVVAAFFAAFVVVVGMVPSGKVGFTFFPDIPEEVISVPFTVEEGLGYGIAHQHANDIEQAIIQLKAEWQQEYPEYPNMIARIYSLVSDDISGRITIELGDKDNRPLSVLDIADAIESRLTMTEGLQELMVLVEDDDDKDLELSLMSYNADDLDAAANEVLAVLTRIKGVKNIHNSLMRGQPQIQFELTPEGRALGMTTQSLAAQIQQSFYGVEVQRIQRGKDEIRVRVLYPAEQRQDITDLQNARVRTPSGELVALSTIATLRSGYTVTEIQRKDGYRSATITANLDPTVTDADEVYERLETDVFVNLRAKYANIQILEDGDAAEEEESAQSLVMIFMFSLLMIYILVAIPLKSYWQPLIIMAVIPFGILGAILGHWYMDVAISILSIFGILALSGVVVNDSLLLVNQYNALRAAGVENKQAMIEAGSMRMRAILLTSLTTCLGLVSLLQETSEQAQFLIPAATSLAFGIAFATLISLVLVPALVMIATDIIQFGRNLIAMSYAKVRQA